MVAAAKAATARRIGPVAVFGRAVMTVLAAAELDTRGLSLGAGGAIARRTRRMDTDVFQWCHRRNMLRCVAT